MRAPIHSAHASHQPTYPGSEVPNPPSGQDCSLGTLEGHVGRGMFTWDCHPGGLMNWLQECTGPPICHILLFSLTTFLNKLALTPVTDLIISLCFVIALSDCQRPVPE